MALTLEQQAEIKWALGALNGSVDGYSRAALYQTYADYYNGAHPLLFANAKFLETFGSTFRANTENLCKLPVDILADLLQVEGFVSRNESDTATPEITAEIWRRNRMDERAGQIHKNAPIFGESYVIVWPDGEGEPVIYPNLPGNVVVEYHSEQLGYIVRAAKYWTEGDRARLTVYTPELITRYRSRNKASTMPSANGFELYETEAVPAEQANPYGKVPIFRFVNNAGVGSSGESELRDIIPPQDRLNKGLCDMLLAAEYSAYPQRYALGIDIKKDADGKVINPFISGPSRMWALETVAGQTANIGELSPHGPENYLALIADARMSIARISGIPPHYFGMDAGGWPSGESLKTSSERLTRKALDRQTSFGNTWADVMRFCLQIKGVADVEIETLWTDPTPRLSELESWQAAQAEQMAGGSRDVTLRARGYSEEMIEAAAEAARNAMFGDGFPPRSADDETETEAA